MIFDCCNDIIANGLLNVVEIDYMAYKKLLSKKKAIKSS